MDSDDSGKTKFGETVPEPGKRLYDLFCEAILISTGVKMDHWSELVEEDILEWSTHQDWLDRALEMSKIHVQSKKCLDLCGASACTSKNPAIIAHSLAMSKLVMLNESREKPIMYGIVSSVFLYHHIYSKYLAGDPKRNPLGMYS